MPVVEDRIGVLGAAVLAVYNFDQDVVGTALPLFIDYPKLKLLPEPPS
ncbi:MAG: hypothetical protein AAF918_16160 [Pseudomonadota bacterium]